jgi:hypothetical protein
VVVSVGGFLGQVKLVVISICLFKIVVGYFGFKNSKFVGFKTVVCIVQTGQ